MKMDEDKFAPRILADHLFVTQTEHNKGIMKLIWGVMSDDPHFKCFSLIKSRCEAT